MTDTTTYARVAQLVEHDLARSGPRVRVPSRALFNKKGIRWMSFFVKSSPAGPGSFEFLRSPLRSLPNSVHQTLTSFAPLRSAQNRRPLDVFASPFHSGRCLTASTGRWLLRSTPVVA